MVEWSWLFPHPLHPIPKYFTIKINIMTTEQITNLVLEYTKGDDLIQCVNFSIDNNWVEPEEYSSYGCRINFLTQDKSSVKDQDGLKEWRIHHHNKYIKNKIDGSESAFSTFPPAYNFIGAEDVEVEIVDDHHAQAVVETNHGSYLFEIETSDENEAGLIINKIKSKSKWVSEYSDFIG